MSRTLTSNRKADFSPLERRDIQTVLNDPIILAICEVVQLDIVAFQSFNAELASQIIDGVARSGVRIEEICKRGHLAQGHVRERFGQSWRNVCELSARFLHAPPAGESLVCEVISARVAETNLDHKGLGREYIKGAGNSLKLIGTSSGRPDRNIRTFEMPLTTGMQHDHTDPDADHGAIARFADALRMQVPGPLHEHIHRILDHRACILRGAEYMIEHGRFPGRERRPVSERFSIDQVFAPWAIVEAIAYGRPVSKHRKWTGIAWPGLDEAVVAEFVGAGVNAVLAAGDDPDPRASLIERGFEPLDDLETPLMPPPAWEVEFWFNPTMSMLARSSSAKDGRGTVRQFWRIVNPAGLSLHGAISAIEHVLEGLPASCLGRHHDDCRPGRLQVSPGYEPDMFASLIFADAASVEAERRYRSGPSRRA